MKARIVLQEGDTIARFVRKGRVDIAAFLDAAFQVRLVEVREGETGVAYCTLELVTVLGHGGGGVDGVVDARAAEGGDLGADWLERGAGGREGAGG